MADIKLKQVRSPIHSSGKQRDTLLMQIANKGLTELTEVVQRTNAQSNAIGETLRGLKPEYDAIRF